jgi:hypothetical protein
MTAAAVWKTSTQILCKCTYNGLGNRCHHLGEIFRRFKSGLCNQLFFPVNEFPAPCNHPNF